MPGQFLTLAEREQLSSFPPSPTEDDIITFFALDQKEIALVKRRSGDLNRLVFAIQLGALRYLGFVPDDLGKTPSVIVEYLASQLNLNPKGLETYQQRPNTRTSQFQQIRKILGWRKPTRLDSLLGENWLLDRAMEHDRPSLLFQLLCDQLRVEKIVRPSVTTLERMVINARSVATTETFNRLQFLLTTSTKAFLDSLLVADDTTGRTPITWLRRHATTNSPNSILNSSLFIGKLQSFPQQNGLLGALQEYGRLVKTNFILRYLNSEDYRRRINTQLNKGEKLHDLRRFLFFAHQGLIRQRQDEDLANQSSCLTLVTNAVVAWNTVYLQAAIEQLKSEGVLIDEADLVHLSPARYEHINPYGRYQFDVAKAFSRQALRPLRIPRSQ